LHQGFLRHASYAKEFSLLARLESISLFFPDKTVLEDVSLTINPKDRIILFGENGSGKTSLFRILTGRIKPNSGKVSLARGLRIGYLEQDFAALGNESTCLEAALEPFGPLILLEQRIARLSERLGQAGGEEMEKLLAELGEAQQRFEAAGGYGFRALTKSTLMGLGLPEPYWGRKVGEMSAGERMRLSLARVLLGEHDLLLFDEPTNHLDIPAREWLEERLSNMNQAYVVASHDRSFLDVVGTKVAHLARGGLTLYAGNYSAFSEQREQQLEAGWRSYEKGQKKIRRLREQAQSYRGWSNAKEKEKRGAADKGFVGHHNLLVLDEPTNHLDIETQDVLLDALQDFPGGILFVSHDRHFIGALATHTLLLG
jgi:ATP-binding cassette subfamily F protein 3